MTSGDDQLAKITGNVEQSRKKIAETLDRFYAEIEGPSIPDKMECIVDRVTNAATTEELWDARDRMEELRGGLFRIQKSTSRNLAEASDAYYDSIRQEKSRGGGGSGHYEEREAKYEMRHIHEYKIMRNLERTLKDVDTFSYYFEGRLRWVKDRLRWLRENEQWSRMKY